MISSNGCSTKAAGASWMRQHKAGMLAAKLTPKQKIKIECARPPTLLKRTIAAELSFQTLEMIKQLQGRH